MPAHTNLEGEKNVYGKNANEHSGDVYAAGEYGGEDIQPREEETHRSLKPRQISMIAIGGTCLLLGVGARRREHPRKRGGGGHSGKVQAAGAGGREAIVLPVSIAAECGSNV